MSAEADFSQLSLFVATPEQAAESRKRSFQEWGNGLSLDEYLARELSLHQVERARKGIFSTWVLAPRNEPGTLDFKCSCETYKRTGIVIRRHNGSVLEPEEVASYGIASVFTPPANRRHGYARHMLQLLHWVIAPRSLLPQEFPAAWGAPPQPVAGTGDALFSTLWSDVGAFYQYVGPGSEGEHRKGWAIRDPVSTIWDVAEHKGGSAATSFEWEWLDENAVEETWKVDAVRMKEEAVAMFSRTSSRVAVSFLPTHHVANFQHQRVAALLQERSTQVEHWGIARKSAHPETAISTFASWTVEIRPLPSTLVVTRLRCDPETFPALVFALLEAAKKYEVEKVEVWNLPAELQGLAMESNGITAPRGNHLPALKWYGEGKDEDVVWLFNEKFPWC